MFVDQTVALTPKKQTTLALREILQPKVEQEIEVLEPQKEQKEILKVKKKIAKR